MKILHINGTHEGGAANYVYKLHNDLLRKKLHSYLYIPKKKFKKNIFYPPGIFNQIIFYTKNLLIRKYFKYFLKDHETNSAALFYSNYLNAIIQKINPDLINLHWIGNETISIKQINEIKKPIIWTIHDMWIFGGSRHYILPQEYFRNYNKNFAPIQKNIFDLNYFTWKNKKNNLNFNINLVCSSKWLLECAKKSIITKNKSLVEISPGINFKKWKSYSKNQARKILKIKKNEKVILFIAAKIFEKRKGFDVFYESLKRIKGQKYTILVVGNIGNHDFINTTHHRFIFYKYEKSHFNKILYYSSSDLLAATSIVEAFGQVICEAAACKTPSIVINNTGCASIIEHKRNGYIAENKEKLDNGIKWIFSRTKKQKKLIDQYSRKFAIRNYNQQLITKKYIDLYKDIIKKEINEI